MYLAESFTVNQQRQRQTSISQMTDGKDRTWSKIHATATRMLAIDRD